MQNTWKCAMITGASAGLGEEFARQLSHSVKKLVLIARREDRLLNLKQSIHESFPNLEILYLKADLADAHSRITVMNQAIAQGFTPDLLINNAGLGDYGEFHSADWQKIESMLRVNMEALSHLTHLALPSMIEAGTGGILHVSSLASIIPIPDFAAYAATKAYVTSFSEALRIELKEKGVQVCVLCPGPVKTEFGEVARRDQTADQMPGYGLFYVKKQQVVAEALRGLESGCVRVFPGKKIAALRYFLGALPICLLRKIMEQRPRRNS